MVAIKGLSMPKYCNDCDFVADSMGYCERAKEQIPNYDFYSETNERPDFCPLTETEDRKVGKWVYDKASQNWRCSVCNETPKTLGYVGTSDFMEKEFVFCNHCGAGMVGADNE